MKLPIVEVLCGMREAEVLDRVYGNYFLRV